MDSKAFTLPASVIGPSDLARLIRELESVEERLHQAGLRAKAAKDTAKPEPANPRGILLAIAKANDYDLEERSQRRDLLKQLMTVQESAPVVTISFAVDPSDEFMAKIVNWFRTNCYPSVLVRVGLQPSITAGCRLRTPSKLYDFSLRNRFDQQRPLLIQRLKQRHEQVQHTLQAPAIEAAHE